MKLFDRVVLVAVLFVTMVCMYCCITGKCCEQKHEQPPAPEVTADIYQMLSQITLTEPGVDGKVKLALKGDGKITYDEMDGIMEEERAKYRAKLLR